MSNDFARFEQAIRSTQVGESTRIAELEEALRPLAMADIDVSGTAACGITANDILRASSVLSKG